MSLKTYKATSAGRRFMRKVVKPSVKDIKNIYKSLKQEGLIGGRVEKKAGRNNQGKVTVRHQGGGVKQLYRKVDYRRIWGRYSLNIVEGIHYSPLCSGFLALLKAEHSDKRWYILAPEGLKIGDIIKGEYYNNDGSSSIDSKIGESYKLKNIEPGKEIYNIDGKFIRSAGNSGIIIKHLEKESQIKMPSGEIMLLNKELRATLGCVSNVDNNKKIIGKAGVSRMLNKRPTVRGEAMNAKDHSHGGKSHGKGGLVKGERTKWGKLAKWVRTRNRKK